MRVWRIGPLAVMVVAMAACGGSTGARLEINGSFTVKYGSLSQLRNVTITEIEQSRPCTGGQVGAGYDDLSMGSEVVVKDQAGTIVATGHLDAGAWADAGCRFPFNVSVPKAEFYRVDVGRRGGGTIARSDVEAGKPLDLTLG